MLFFKCRQLSIKNAKIWRLFSLRNNNKNKSRNLDLLSDNAGDHSDRLNSADVDLQEVVETFAVDVICYLVKTWLFRNFLSQ